MGTLKKAIIKIPSCLRNVFCGYLAFVLIAIALFAPFLNFACKKELAQFGFIFIPLSCLLGLCLFFFCSRITFAPVFKDKLRQVQALKHAEFGDKGSCARLFLVLGCLLLISQLIMMVCCYFVTGWDVEQLTDVDNRVNQSFYFSTYPNGLFLAGVFNALAQFCSIFGTDNPYPVFVLGGILCTNASIVLATFVGNKLFGKKWAIVSFSIMAVFIGWNPMCMVPYSDSYGMICPSLVLYIFFCGRNVYSKCFGIVFWSYIGYVIKPTSIFILISIVIFCLCRGGANKEQLKANLSVVARCTAVIIISGVLTTGTSEVIKQYSNVEIEQEKSFSAAHYLMMGLNEERLGVYSVDDVRFSQTFNSRQERDMANVEVWMGRIQKMGPIGVAKLFVKKSLTNYDSGIFSFLVEGPFLEIHGISRSVMDWYGIPAKEGEMGSSSSSPWAILSQILWFILLVGITLLPFSGELDERLNVLAVTLLLLSGFLILFECRARYLFLYSPYYVLLSVSGWKCWIRARMAFK